MAIIAMEKILTLDYWKYAYQLKPGDYVFNQNGKLVKVKLVQEYRADDCYEVMFDDYLTASGDIHLGFMCETPKYRNRLQTYKGVHKFRRPLKHFAVQDLLETSLISKTNSKLYSVPTTKPLQLPHQDLPVPPFVFGFWFFARGAHSRLTAPKEVFEFVTTKLKDYGYKLKFGRMQPNGERDFKITPSIESQLIPNMPKTIPNNYLLASEEQRVELLSGILCAKNRQYSEKTDKFRITSKHLGTITLIQGLVESLACRTRIRGDEYKKNYVLFFKSRSKLLPNQISPPVKVHHARRYITSITPIPGQSCVHIETDGEDSTILVGEGFIPCS